MARVGSQEKEIFLRSDNGSPMRALTLKASLEALGLVPSYGRPRVSNDNAFSEAVFKTLKYHQSYPSKGFELISEARRWCDDFVQWYNTKHQHSSLLYTTPEQCHQGESIAILNQRKAVYEEARAKHPERWSRGIKNFDLQEKVELSAGRSYKKRT